KCQNPAGHEPGGAHRSAVSSHLGDFDNASTGVDLYTPPVASGHDLVGADLVARIDHDLYPVSAHAVTVAAGSTVSTVGVAPPTEFRRYALAVSNGVGPLRAVKISCWPPACLGSKRSCVWRTSPGMPVTHIDSARFGALRSMLSR